MIRTGNEANGKNRLRIAFISAQDARNKRNWSGTKYYSMKSLSEHCGDVDYVGPYPNRYLFNLFRGLSYIIRKTTGKRYNYFHAIVISKVYGRFFTRKIKQKKYDLIFTPAGSLETAYLKTTIPIIQLTDATFTRLIDYYPEYSHLFAFSQREGIAVERRAFMKASLLVFSSSWAADSAEKDYKIPIERIAVIPLGANIDTPPDRSVILAKRKTDICRLIFIGVNWERKGGSIAFGAFQELKKRGIKTTLTVIGTRPPADYADPDLTVIPFIDKNTSEGRSEFNRYLLQSDFLILPSRCESFGIVFAEASAYGIPSIAPDTGGVSSVVKHGINGILLPYNAGGKEYADAIELLFTSDTEYYRFVENARNLFEEKLNWDHWGKEMSKKLKEITALP